MTKDEALKLALDALDLLAKYENPSTKIQVRKPRDGGPIVTMYPHKVATDAAALLRERLAQPEQEPVALPVGWVDDGGTVFWKDKPPADGADLYTVIDKSAAIRIATALGWEPKRKPLTNEEIDAILKRGDVAEHDAWNGRWYVLPYSFARAIEAAYGIKE